MCPTSRPFVVLAKLYIPDAGGTGTVELFVTNYTIRGRLAWYTGYRKQSGFVCRLNRVSLPIRSRQIDAVEDLLDFAARKRHPVLWKEA